MTEPTNSFLRVFVVVLALIPVCLVAAEDVFVVSDIYAVKPDGTCYETKDGQWGELARENAHWSAETKTIRMFAARNEEVAVQIVIPAKGQGYWGRMEAVNGPGSIAPDRTTFSAVVWNQGPNNTRVPDLVVPLDGSIRGLKRFDVPAQIEGLYPMDNTVGVMLFELWVPQEAKPGTYAGKISVMRQEKEFAKLNLELTVFDFALPDAPTFAMDFLSYDTPGTIVSKQGNEDAAGPADTHIIQNSGLNPTVARISDKAKAIDYQVYKLLADNRCFLNILPYHSQRGQPRIAYPVSGTGALAKITSFAEYDDYVAPILDGKLNKFGAPPAHFTLAFNSNYPHLCQSEPSKQFDWRPFKSTLPDGPGKESALKEFEETHRAIAEQTVAHFAEKGWKNTRFEIYHNQKAKPDRNRLPWKLDEPVTGDDYKALRYFLNTGKWAFESAKAAGIQVVTRIDLGHFHCENMCTLEGQKAICFKKKEWDKAGAQQILGNVVDHWVVGLTHGDGAHHKIPEYRRPGVKMMCYCTGAGGGMLLDNRCVYAGLGYVSAKRGTEGLILYKVGLENPNQAPNRDVVLYGGQVLGVDGALCPKRLKLLRNCVNDFEYIVEARKKDAAATQAVVDMMAYITESPDPKYRTQSKSVGLSPTNNPEDFLAARLKLAAIISGNKSAGPELQGRSDRFAPCQVQDDITGYD